MQTKLTLRIDEQIIKKAKIISMKKGKSLSKIVSDYLQSLDESTNSVKDIPPVTKSLIGILKNRNINEKDYKKHLAKKHM